MREVAEADLEEPNIHFEEGRLDLETRWPERKPEPGEQRLDVDSQLVVQRDAADLQVALLES